MSAKDQIQAEIQKCEAALARAEIGQDAVLAASMIGAIRALRWALHVAWPPPDPALT